MLPLILLVSVCAVGLFGMAATVLSVREHWLARRRLQQQQAVQAERLAEVQRLALERAIMTADAEVLAPIQLPTISAPEPARRRMARGSTAMPLRSKETRELPLVPSVFIPGTSRARVTK
jgi:hypothetical protein